VETQVVQLAQQRLAQLLQRQAGQGGGDLLGQSADLAQDELGAQGGIVLGGDPQGGLEGGWRIALQSGKAGLARVHGHTPVLSCF